MKQGKARGEGLS